MKNQFQLLLFTCFISLLLSCSKEDANFTSDALSDYMPLSVGKYFIYKLDSLKFVQFGEKDTIIRYQAKDVVDAAFTDAQGRPSYRMIRYLRDSASTSEAAWKPNSTYALTITREGIEMVDFNNFRIQSLKLPVKQDFFWKGNTFLAVSPYEGLFEFTIDADIANWDFIYTGTEQTSVVNGKTYNNVITVEHVNDSSNVSEIPLYVASKRYSTEQYARGIGLIYKEVILWEFQPKDNPIPNRPPVSGYKEGYGMRLRLISYN